MSSHFDALPPGRAGIARLPLFLACALCCATLAADLLAPAGIATGIAYLAPVLYSHWFHDRKSTLVFAGVSSALIVVGFFGKYAGGVVAGVDALNRALCIGVLWGAVILINRARWQEQDRKLAARKGAALIAIASGETRSLGEPLELHASDRTAELERINQELEDFAHIAAHDLKAPLRVIDNASRWLEEDLQQHFTPQTREHVALLRDRVRRLQDLLNDLLEYSRIGRAAGSRFVETVAGDVLIENILILLSPAPRFTVIVSPAFADIQVARMPLQQILMNLVGNAIAHHNKAKGTIEVTVEDRGSHYLFAVGDDGPGIPEAFHGRIFKPLHRLKPQEQGSGMGLAMVRKNLELFGGQLALESAEGRGSTFRFTWPKQQTMKGRSPSPALAVSGEAASGTAGIS